MQEIEQKALSTHEIMSQKAKINFEKRRRAGYEKWLKKKHKEMERKKELERIRKEKEKEKKRLKRDKEKEKERIKRAEEKLKKKEKKDTETRVKKKKVGRPKKPGPKKKRKSRAKKKYKPRKIWDYKIISFHKGKQCGYHGKYYDPEHAYDKINELLEENKNIVFPKKIENNEILENARYEYVILEKNRHGDKVNLGQRNEYGKVVKQELSTDKWVILEKFPYDVEETFWVWGFNPNTERKTFDWIYENIIMDGIETQYDIKRVFLYKNKIIVKDDNNNIEMIICKTQSDSIRFYNLIDDWNKKRKNKNVIMLGSLNLPGERKRKIEAEIMKLTGWTLEKTQQSGTKKHLKK